MTESPKFGSMLHLPWSEEAPRTRTNKVLDRVDPMMFTEGEAVKTEKIDGGNSAITGEENGVFARTHGHEATHKSFDLLKKAHREGFQDQEPLRYQINQLDGNYVIYGEWTYAVHTIEYSELPELPFIVFGVLDLDNMMWQSWEKTKEVAATLGLEHAPVLEKGKWDEEKFQTHPEGESEYGDTREGYVIRTTEEFHHSEFKRAMAKCVRHEHVKSDEHWRKGEVETNGTV